MAHEVDLCADMRTMYIFSLNIRCGALSFTNFVRFDVESLQILQDTLFLVAPALCLPSVNCSLAWESLEKLELANYNQLLPLLVTSCA